MDRTVSKGKWPQFLVIAVLLLLFLFGGYYFIYVSHQKAYLTDRNFRLLGLTSQQIQARLEHLSEALKRTTEESISKLKLSKWSAAELEEFKKRTEGYIKNISGLENSKITFFELKPQDRSEKTSEKQPEEFEVERKRDTVKAYFRFQIEVKNIDNKNEKYYLKMKFHSNLVPLLKPLVNRSEFDNVLVVKEPKSSKGEYEVLFQRESRGIQILTLPLPPQKNPPLETKTQNRANRLETIELGGTRYKVFLQPLQLSLATSSDETQKLQWFVCGLVRADRFLSESFSFPIPILLGFVVLLPTAFLAWPFLKLWFMRPRERLSTWDVVFLLSSLFFGSALFILLLLNIYAYWQLEENIDQQLKDLSENVQTNLNIELDAIHEQITDSMIFMDYRVNEHEDKEKREKKKTKKENSILFKTNVELKNYPTYPYFNFVFLVDSLGEQRGKWTAQAQTTPQINLYTREYVSRILYCSSWVGLRNGEMRRFYVEPIFSWNTGENLTVYSVPLERYPSLECLPVSNKDSSEEKDKSKLAVAALATRPVSLTQPVLPPGFGYAVITADGSVLFHVDDTHNLRENFFEETAGNKRLRSAVFGHTAEWVDTSYGGTPHRLYVRPIDGLPWFLIVYRDKELLSTARLEIFSVAVILALAYFVMLVVWLLLYLWISGDRLRWLWPTPTQTAAYWCFGVINLMLCMLLCMWVWGGRVTEWLWHLACVVMVIVPVLEFVLIYCVLGLGLSLGFPRGSMGARKRDSGWFRFGYVFAMASIFLTLSVFPMLAFFKVAHDAEMTLLIKHGQLQIAKAIDERKDRVKNQYLSINVDNTDLFLQKRLKLNGALDIYASFFFGTKMDYTASYKATTHREASGLAWMLRKIRPLYNEASLVLHGVSEPNSVDQLWPTPPLPLPPPLAWTWEPQQKQLILTKNRVESGSSLHITSTIPVLGGSIEGYGWIILLSGFVIFLVLLYISVRIIARRVFLRDVLDPQRPLNLPALQARAVSDNLLVIGSPFAGKSAWLQQRVQQDDWQVIDFHQDSETRNEERVTLESHKVIALDHFEYRLGVPEQDHAKLLLLEKTLSTHQQRVVIVSTVDPMALYGGDLAEREGAPGAAPASSHERDSWARIFSSFLTVYLNDEENVQNFADDLSDVQGRIVERAGSSAAKHQRESLHLLEKECRPMAYLREIGRKMVTAPAFAECTTENLKKVIWDRVCAYYQVVWSTCSPGEQFLLICLAEDRFVNTRNPDIDRLLRKRLIVREPELRLMNASFEQFVRSATPPPQVSTWEEEVRHSGWNMLKGPLLVVLVGVGLFLYATQPDLFNATAAFVSAVAAGGAPALLKLFSTFVQGDKAKP